MKIINTSYIESISDGEKEFISELIDTFSESHIAICKQIQEAYDKQDFDMVGQLAHQLKPSIKMLELPCSETIILMKEEPEKTNQEMITQVQTECVTAEEQLNEWADTL